jgi:hypothetical protein
MRATKFREVLRKRKREKIIVQQTDWSNPISTIFPRAPTTTSPCRRPPPLTGRLAVVVPANRAWGPANRMVKPIS